MISIFLTAFAIHLLGLALSFWLPASLSTAVSMLVGWPIFFLGGGVFYYLFYRRSLENFDLPQRILLMITLSLALLPVPLVIGQGFGLDLSQQSARISYLLFMVVLFIILVIKILALHYQLEKVTLIIVTYRQKLLEVPSWSWISLLFGLLFFSLHFLLYCFLPETDSYGWATILRTVERTGQLSTEVSRFQYVNFMQTLAGVTQIPIYWLYKIVFPLLIWIVAWLSSYSLINRQEISPRFKFLLSLTLLTIPVFVEEALVSRPQSIAIIFYISILLLLSTAVRRKQLDILILCFMIAAGSFRYHELNSFLALTGLLSGIYAYRHEIKASPKRSLLGIGVFMLLAALALKSTSVGSYISATFNLFLEALKKQEFRLWFINHYVNVDGLEVGWPGKQAILYYVYNLGLTLPFILLFWLFAKRWYPKLKKVDTGRSFFPYLVATLLFLIFAEGVPRLGFYPLPDRAWLFLVISLSGILLMQASIWIKPVRQWRLSMPLLIASIIVSLAGSIYITHAKQGRVSRAEYAASQFILKQTKPNALFLSQPGNNPVIKYFGDRRYLQIDSFFAPTIDNQKRQSILMTTLDPRTIVDERRVAKEELRVRVRSEMNKLDTLALPEEVLLSHDRVVSAYSQLLALMIQERDAIELLSDSPDVYIVFSTDKFKGLYATRQWWRLANYSNFDPTVLESMPQLKPVFQNEAVQIWQLIP